MINIHDIINIPNLFLKSKLILKGYYSGIHRVPFKGLSSEFSQYREYMPGDDFDKIDWKVYLRTEKFYVKESESEVNTDMFIMYDTSRSMDYGNKSKYASTLAFLLAYIAYNQGDNVGYCFFNESINSFVKPMVNRRILLDFAERIDKLKYENKTNIDRSIMQIIDRLRKNTFFILISDFAVDNDNYFKILKGIRTRGNDVIVFHIIDKSELSKEVLDNTVLKDNETGEIDDISSYEHRIQAINKKHYIIKQQCIENDIDYMKFITDDDFYEALNLFFFRRK